MSTDRNARSSSGVSRADDDGPEVEPPVAIGEVVANKYVIESIIGTGGMGVVVAARHRVLQSRFALKLLHVGRSDDKFVRRLMREAEIIAQLKSPHVIRVFDVGVSSSGATYIVMELLEGEDLATKIEREGRIPVPQAVGFLLEACEAIAEAHDQGVIHRDLKPGNLFLAKGVDERPILKVLDFGISKRTGAGAGHAITQPNELLGSPGYMAPEQIRGASAADTRSDIWALGVILYELLSGEVAFDGDVLHEIFARISIGKVEPLPDSIPEGLRAIVDRCLAHDPAERFESVNALATALLPFANARRIVVVPPVVPPAAPAVAVPSARRIDNTTIHTPVRSLRPAVLALGAVVLLGIAAVSIAARSSAPAAGPGTSATPASARTVTSPAPRPVVTEEPAVAPSAPTPAPTPTPSARARPAPAVSVVSPAPSARPSVRKVDPEEFLRQR